MDDVSQLRGKRSTYSDNKAAVSSIDEYVFVLFGLCSSHHPHRSAHNESQRRKKKLCIFQFLRPRGGRSLVIASTGTAAQQDSHMSFPHSHSDRFLLPHRRRIFFNDRSLKALPVNKSPRPSAPTGHDTDIFFCFQVDDVRRRFLHNQTKRLNGFRLPHVDTAVFWSALILSKMLGRFLTTKPRNWP